VKASSAFAILVVAAYGALELFAAAKARPRMEPDFMYRSMVAARVAAESCGGVPQEQEARFQENLERMRRRVRTKLAQSEAGPDSAAIDAAIADLTRQAEKETAAALAEEGCGSYAGRRLLRRHEIRAR
jgi:hypothetical protein